MQFQTRTWFLISLSCFLAAIFFWQLSEHLRRRGPVPPAPPAAETPPTTPPEPKKPAAPTVPPAATNRVSAAGPVVAAAPAPAAATTPTTRKDPFPYRLRNTPRTVNDLGRSDQAILLRNALIDSSVPVNLAIPEHLRAAGDPGAYVVQARGLLTDAFRAQLAQAGAQIVSYVPNNAYLVRATAETARQLGVLAETQAVLPWEPYYKLEPRLLELAVEKKPLASGTRLNVVAFPDTADAVRQALAQSGIEVSGDDRTPFGTMLIVRPPADALPMLAGLPGVQAIERNLPRKPANDLARARVKASANVGPNSGDSANYRGLTGAGVVVNVNDTGVDAMHPALTGRVTGDSPFTEQDFDGHGTHVSGIIAGNGAAGPPDPSMVPGSFTNSNFRGMAPDARIFAQPIDLNFGPFTSDAALQETAASMDAFISNNSWGFPGANDYTFASASWDAAARDALPGVTGSQPLTLVFAAGNDGAAGDDGLGGFPGTISAPATGKNVISVGAVESYRNITNEFIVIGEEDGMPVTNVFTPFLAITDSSNQVASFSSRGNVGIGIEGDFGRFKPDLVAPGAMIVSTRSKDAPLPDSLTNVVPNNIFDQKLAPGQTNLYALFVPFDGFQFVVQVVSNRFSPSPFPPLLIQVGTGGLPNPGSRVYIDRADVNASPGVYFYTIANTNKIDVHFDIRSYVVVAVEPPAGYFEVLGDLNATAAPSYRFETGTSQATPVVTGLIAMMRQFFAQIFGRTNSPALNKALLINGARTLANQYDFQIDATVNAQGWGLVNITNSIPEGASGVVSGENGNASGTVIFYDQSPARALVTGQSITRFLNVPEAGRDFPLRVTLAWTDPPGNPAIGIKLVNDLDLVVTNLTTGEIYYGNYFGGGGIFTSGSASNAAPLFDFINNVENVYLNRGLSAQYSVTVRARRVNVNAVTDHPTGIAQDFALVISTEWPDAPGIGVADQPPGFDGAPVVTIVTNGVPLLNQRVGANSPLILSTNGENSQWHFFIVTNQLPSTDMSGGSPTHIAFTTFLTANLAIPRTSDEADIDLYVSTDPNLTNLNTAVINAAFKSRTRGGTESIVIDNAQPGALYYVGVKSEDQQAATFGLFAVSSSAPFSGFNQEGNVTATGYLLGSEIPDGTPDRPQAALVFAFVTQDARIESLVVTNVISHESIGDLLGNLSHNGRFAVLNNHSVPPLPYIFVYDDSDSGDILVSQPVDGPGSLNNFIGEQGAGVWQLTMIDNTPFHTGRVDRIGFEITPQREDLLTGVGVDVRIMAMRFLRRVFTVDVPGNATNLSVCVVPQGGPLEVYIRRDALPTRTEYDTFGTIPVGGGCVTLGRRDSPPLSAGRYFVRIFNPNPVQVTANVRIQVDLDLNRSDAFTFRSGQAMPILDDALTVSTIHVNRDQQIADVSVGVRIDHPRVSDLVLHLVSPSGTRVLLAENRGGPNAADYGGGGLQTNTFPVQTSGGAFADTNILAVSEIQGTIQIDYQFFTVGDTLRIYYEGTRIFDSQLASGGGTFSVDYGPGTSTNVTIIVNEGNNPNASTLWNYTATVFGGYNYATFTENTNLARFPIKFAPPPFTSANAAVTNVFTNVVVLDDSFEDPPPRGVQAGERLSGWEVATGNIELWPALVFPPYFLQPDSGQYFIDISGSAPGILFTNLATVPGGTYQVSFAYARNNANPDTVSANVKVDGATALALAAPVGVATNWVHTNFVFQAASPSTRLELESTTRGTRDDTSGMFFDTFHAVQISQRIEEGIFYFPEEPLTPLFGENAFGDWKLEVLDNRRGAIGTNATLLSWKLNFTFVNTNPAAIPLTNGLTYCGSLGTNETAFFQVSVPVKASAVSNLVVAGGDVSLIFQQYGLPAGQQPPDTFLQSNVVSGVSGLGTNGWESYNLTRTILRGSDASPVLLPGRKYYLAVQNESPATNSYCVQVDFSVPVEVIPLTNGFPFCGALGSTFSNNIVGAQTFVFNVSTAAVQATFQTFHTSGDVDLFAQYGTNFTNFAALLTLATNYPYSSTNLGIGDEIIRVNTNSTPVALTNGPWYLAVINREPTNVNYCVVAKEVLATNIIRLTNGVPYTATNSGGGTGTVVPIDYFVFTVPPDAKRAQWEALQPSSDVTLVLKKDLPLPDLSSAAAFSARGGATDELIFLYDYTTNLTLTPGDWYMGVVNATGTTNVYTAQARWYSVYGTNFNFSSSLVATGYLCLTWTNTLMDASYHVLAANSPSPAYWVPIPPSLRATSNEVTWCTPMSSGFTIFRFAEGLVPELYPALSHLDGSPVPTNGFTVRWSAPLDQSYRLERSTLLTPPSWQSFTNTFLSTNGLFEFFDGPYTNGVPPYQFYRFFQLP